MQILNHFFPGAIGTIAALHGQHYAKHWGFGAFFEAKVAAELGSFAQRVAANDLVLLAQDESGLAASLILDLNDPASGPRGAHLRWFIAADRARGTGVGRALLARAIAHCDTHCGGKVWLTTFQGLHPARHLYETFGFTLCHEAEGEAWGTRVTEQEFQRNGA
jgi:GNAT superfamily N-acetyltransferase